VSNGHRSDAAVERRVAAKAADLAHGSHGNQVLVSLTDSIGI
jgi:hypothetical protein